MIARPVITTQPQPQAIVVGRTLRVGVSIDASPGCSYQWFKNGAALEGEVYEEYIVGYAVAADSGDYTCTVINAAGSVTTDKATVSVTPPVVTPPVVTSPIVPPLAVTPQVVMAPAVGGLALPRLTAAYPPDAYLLPAAQASQLQSALDTYKVVRLEGASYNHAITMKSGYQLYGLPATDFRNNTITIQPGTTGAVINGIAGTVISFPSGTASTMGNVFKRMTRTQVKVLPGAVVESNLFLDFNYCVFYVDTQAGGYWRNNRVIFLRTQSTRRPDITLKGDAARSSYGNVFLWKNFLSSYGGGANLVNQGDVAFVGFDAEAWGNSNGVNSNALFYTDAMGVLRVFAANGGTTHNGSDIFNLGADEFQMQGAKLLAPGTGLIYRNTNKRSLLIAVSTLSVKDQASGATRINATGINALPAASQAVLNDMIKPTRAGVAWEGPTFAAIPDPMGANWRTIPAGHVDSTAMIQAGVNANGIFMLAAGTYYVDGTILLRNGQGVIGAGDGKTIIIATNPAKDIFTVNLGGKFNKVFTGAMTLMDMTLYGGANQLHFNTPGDQPNDCVISYVTFRNAATAGISVDKIYGMDNNFFDSLNFVNCGTGFKQVPDPNYPARPAGQTAPLLDGTSTMAYIDKTMLYGCQFIGCGTAADMEAKRTNNLDAFVSCLFSGNGSVGKFSGHNALLMANCDLINNGGNPTLSSQVINLVSCYFIAGARGTGAMLTGDVNAEGCMFQRGGSPSATIMTGPGDDYFTNCQSTDMPLGAKNNGLLLNSLFDSSVPRQAGVRLAGGVATVFLSGTPTPAPQLLFGTAFAGGGASRRGSAAR